jgi:cell wall-associated NlpC family hydrolase
MSLFPRALAPFFIAMVFVIAPTGAMAQATGGMAFEEEPPPPEMVEPGRWSGPEVPGTEAVLLEDGTAAAPADAPDQVKQAIWAANSLQTLPYRYGGGHNLKFDVSDGADCSGTISFALHAGGLLKAPLDSGSFMKWGEKGKGDWITVYTNPGHAYVVIAGLRLDTSLGTGTYALRSRKDIATTAFERGPRWRPWKRPAKGFVKRHPLSF